MTELKLKRPGSGLWKPQPGDKFEPSQLKKALEFFNDDLRRAKADLIRIEKFATWKLTPSKKGFGNMIAVAKRGVWEAETNLATCKKLIENLK